MWPGWGLLWFVLALGAALKAKPGKKLLPASLLLLIPGLLTRQFIAFLSPGGFCPQESKNLQWISRSWAAYDAFPFNGGFLVGRGGGWKKDALIFVKGGQERPLLAKKSFQAFARGRGLVYAADWGGDRVATLRGEEIAVSKICRWPIELAAYGKGALLLCERDHELHYLQGFPAKSRGVIKLPKDLVNPYGIAVDEAGGVAWVSSWGMRGAVARVDLRTRATKLMVSNLPSMGLTWVPSRSELWLAQPLNAQIARLNPETLKTIGTLKTGFGVRRLATWDNQVAAVSYFEGLVHLYDTDTLATMAVEPVGKLGRGIRPDGRGNFLVSSGCGVARVGR